MASTILIVEDDPTISEVLDFQLRRAGYRVIVADDGVAALRSVRAHNPDLVLLDLMLPRVSGLDVLRILRREWSMPVIVISARDAEPDKITGLELGADDYVTKPFSVKEVLARVQAALRRASVEPADGPPEAPAIAIDPEQHEVRKWGRRVQLTPKEFELLAYLVRNANRVCTRDAILDAIWGYGYDGENRTVDVHMHWLRQKLEDDPAHPAHLITVRHYGYRFIPHPTGTEDSSLPSAAQRGAR